MGHDVKIVMPRYYKIDRSKLTKLEGPMAIAAGQVETWSAVYTTTMPGCDSLPVYFIDHEYKFFPFILLLGSIVAKSLKNPFFQKI